MTQILNVLTLSRFLAHVAYTLLFKKLFHYLDQYCRQKPTRRANSKATAGPKPFAIPLIHTSCPDNRGFLSRRSWWYCGFPCFSGFRLGCSHSVSCNEERPRERSGRGRFLHLGIKTASYRGAYRVPLFN